MILSNTIYIIHDLNRHKIGRASSQFTENVIKEYKKGLGDMVLVAITPRTTIELPAHLTQAEIDARVEIYKKLHSSKV